MNLFLLNVCRVFATRNIIRQKKRNDNSQNIKKHKEIVKMDEKKKGAAELTNIA